MSLTRKQMEEIVRFDWKRRTGLDFDGRRFGSVTGAHAPHVTGCYSLCHGSHVFKGRKNPPRKTLRYNYIEVGRAPAKSLGEVFAGKAKAWRRNAELGNGKARQSSATAKLGCAWLSWATAKHGNTLQWQGKALQ